MIRAIFLGNLPRHFAEAYDAQTRAALRQYYALDEHIVTEKELSADPALGQGVQAVFSTWGMPSLREQEIRSLLPDLKIVFYAAGSVQAFAPSFMKCGVRIVHAAKANALPVAQFVAGLVLLSNKGAWQAMRRNRIGHGVGHAYSNACVGNYHPTIGIIGVGEIGKLVATRMRSEGWRVLYYDPYLPKAYADAHGLESRTLPELFEDSDCITNHLADKDELVGVLNDDLFSRMKPYATFINTGRGRQVNEKALIRALRRDRTRTAVLDVTHPEPPRLFSPLRRMRNVVLFPHIAGSLGGEIARMGEYVLADAVRWAQDEPLVYEVRAEQLTTMA